MRESIGETFTYNIVIIFIVIVIGLLVATLNYYKAFKVNTQILDTIKKYEGYNSLAEEEIRNNLISIGYTSADAGWQCPKTKAGYELVGPSNNNLRQSTSHYYCVYYYSDDRGQGDKTKSNNEGKPVFYNYSVVTYIFVDLPLAGNFKIPVRTKGERIYNFSSKHPADS